MYISMERAPWPAEWNFRSDFLLVVVTPYVVPAYANGAYVSSGTKNIEERTNYYACISMIRRRNDNTKSFVQI